MPMSSDEGKPWIRERIWSLAGADPVSVLDIGPGVGTYAKLLRGPAVAHLTGLEVWAPYVETYRLREHYDEIVIGDARTTRLPQADVVVLGDVLEHMPRTDALQLWERSATAARRAVYLSIPIVHYPQGEIEANPYEVHVEDDWDHDSVLQAFGGIGAHWLGSEVGVYERRTV